MTPNHALQRTAPCVTAPASTATFPPTAQVPRRTPRSLSLGSLGRFPMHAISQSFALVALSLAVVSCSTSPVLHPMLDGYPGTITQSEATARFRIPDGWQTVQRESHRYGGHSHGRYSITPISAAHEPQRPVIDILFGRLDPTEPATEAGQVHSYLDGTHHHTDSTLRSESVGSAQNPQHGAITIYHMYSPYSGERLYAQIVDAPLGFSCELICSTSAQLAVLRPAFEALLRSITINDAQTRPNHALQRTATLAFSYRCAAVTSTGSVTACAPATKPSTCRAFASRRFAHARVPGSRSLSLGSLGVAMRLLQSEVL